MSAPERLLAGLDRPLEPLPPRLARRAARQLAAGAADRDFYLAISYVPRKLGKADLRLGPSDLAAADAARPGWDPERLERRPGGAHPAAARRRRHAATRSRSRLEQLFVTADIGETITFYRGLPLYPDPKRHVARAREGARSGMQPIFEAVAHRNPYPAEQFDENAWNHLVLKALFIGSKLDPIQGLDRRANPALMRMLCDYAHERWAAGRPVSPELWRCVGPHADGAALADLERVLETGSGRERQAAALALRAPRAGARAMLASRAPTCGRSARPAG